MVHYRATFKDGRSNQIKNSRRTYTHAWRALIVTHDGLPHSLSGFAGSEKLAHKNSATEARFFTTKPHRGYPNWKPAQSVEFEIVPVEIIGGSA